MPTTARIADYYIELQRREGLEPPLDLVAEWEPATAEAIGEAFRTALLASKIPEQDIPLRDVSMNQSVGNQVAEFFVLSINPHLVGYRIYACAGAGYPDKILIELASNRSFPFELKATAMWKPTDSPRRVLTASSRKLRQRFQGAANHILATVKYVTQNGISRANSCAGFFD
jgi:hypothetical protein